MKKLSFISNAKRDILTVGIVFLTLKLLKAATFGWFITLSPILLLVCIEILFLVWGYFMYRNYKRKNGY
jgi:hypothetical protein